MTLDLLRPIFFLRNLDARGSKLVRGNSRRRLREAYLLLLYSMVAKGYMQVEAFTVGIESVGYPLLIPDSISISS